MDWILLISLILYISKWKVKPEQLNSKSVESTTKDHNQSQKNTINQQQQRIQRRVFSVCLQQHHAGGKGNNGKINNSGKWGLVRIRVPRLLVNVGLRQAADRNAISKNGVIAWAWEITFFRFHFGIDFRIDVPWLPFFMICFYIEMHKV